MVDRKLDLGLYAELMMDDYRRQEVVVVIQQEDLSLYNQAGNDSGFRVRVVNRPGEVHRFDVTGEDENFDGDRLIREGELAIEVLAPEGQKERDYSVFWETFEQLKQEAQQPK